MKTKSFLSIFVLFLGILFLGCSEEIKNIETPYSIGLSRSEQEIIDSQVRFAFEYFKSSSYHFDETNFVISPLSLSINLAMLSNGAGEKTYQEIVNVLELPETSTNELNVLYKKLIDELMKADKKAEFITANSFWYNDNIEVFDVFKTSIQDYYNTTLHSVDFNNDSNVKNAINKWAADNTKDNIQNYINDTDLPGSIAILLNAVYFDGKWSIPFKESKGTLTPFTNIDNSISEIKTLNSNRDDYLCASTEIADLIRLPYGNGAFSMYLILPSIDGECNDNKSIFNNFVDRFDYDCWQSLKNQLNLEKTVVTMPKFRVETKIDQIGNGILPNLSSITNNPDLCQMANFKTDELVIKIEQANIIEVTEDGTKAAAVSSSSMLDEAAFSKGFIVTRPFIYLIEEQSTGAIMFIGKVVKL